MRDARDRLRGLGSLWIDVLFFLSGATALGYEIAWTRRLSLSFGSTAAAIAVILALFLLGLALGSIVLPRRVLAFARDPLSAYGLLELAAGMLALGFPVFLPWADTVLEGLDPGRAEALVRGAIAALLVVPPTMALGGTLPVLAQAFADHPNVDRRVGRLYSWNTFGACAGVLVTAFFLLPHLGQFAVLVLLPATNVAIGVAALVAARAGRKAVATAPPGAATRRGVSDTSAFPDPGRGLFGFAFLSGFLLLALEVGVARFISLSVSQSIYGFAIMLVTFIGGLTIGAFAAGRLDAGSAGAASSRLAEALVVGSAGIALVPTALGNLPWWLAPAVTSGRSSPFALWVFLQLAASFLILLPATLSLGVMFPILLRRAAKSDERSRIIGWLYGWNTLGAILGSCIGGFLLLPAIGPRVLLLVLAALSLAAGSYAILRRGSPPGWLLVPAVVAVSLVLLPHEVDPELLSRSPAVYAKTEAQLESQRRARGSQRRLEYVAHDQQGTVVVGTQVDPRGTSFRFFSVNGKIDGGESPQDMATQVELATTPLLLFDHGKSSPKTALIIGLGTGVSVGAALTFPLETVDVVEISRPMVDVARRYFGEVNLGAVDDSRTRVHVADGRKFLASSRARYDVIVSEPSNPWIAGIGSLFTKEAFELCRKRLSPGGVMCQWVQTYDLDEASFRMIVATFTDVFPESYLFATDRTGVDFMLIGLVSSGHESFSRAALTEALARGAGPSKFDPYTSRTLEELADRFLAGPGGLRAYAAPARRNTDDNGALEFAAPKSFLNPRSGLHGFLSLVPIFEPLTAHLSPDDGESGVLTDVARSAALSWRLFAGLGLRSAALGETGVVSAAVPARAFAIVEEFTREHGPCSEADRIVGLLYGFGSGRDPEWLERFGPGWEKGRSIEFLRLALASRDLVETRLALALSLEHDPAGTRSVDAADLQGAEGQYRTVLERELRNRQALVGLASLWVRGNRRPEAERLLAKESRREDGDPDVIAFRGVLLTERSAWLEAVELLEGALARHPQHDHLKRALALAQERRDTTTPPPGNLGQSR